MRLAQKIGLAGLLCLSIVMVLISAIRMTAYANHPGLIDITWTYFWMCLESCVAIIMASISVIGPFFVNKGRVKKANDKEKNQVPLTLDQEWLKQKSKGPNQVRWEEKDRELLLAAPLASLIRMHKFLYDDAPLTEGTETVQSTSHSADKERQSYVLSPRTKEFGSE